MYLDQYKRNLKTLAMNIECSVSIRRGNVFVHEFVTIQDTDCRNVALQRLAAHANKIFTPQFYCAKKRESSILKAFRNGDSDSQIADSFGMNGVDLDQKSNVSDSETADSATLKTNNVSEPDLPVLNQAEARYRIRTPEIQYQPNSHCVDIKGEDMYYDSIDTLSPPECTADSNLQYNFERETIDTLSERVETITVTAKQNSDTILQHLSSLRTAIDLIHDYHTELYTRMNSLETTISDMKLMTLRDLTSTQQVDFMNKTKMNNTVCQLQRRQDIP